MDLRLRGCLVWAMIAFAIAAPAVQNEDSPAGADLTMDTPMLTQEFDAVNDFCMDIDGLRETVNSEVECRDKCEQNFDCRSYSWSSQGTEQRPGKTCVWTRKFIAFDPNWEFHTRTYAVDWSGKMSMVGEFHTFPGMRFVEDRFHQELKDLDVEQCLAACENDVPCKGFSYNSDLALCQLSDSGLRYAPGFTYNERNQAIPGRHGKFRHFPATQSVAEKENTGKHVMKQKLLAQVDKKARLRQAEITTKAAQAHKLKQIAMQHMAAEAARKQERIKEQKKKDKSRAENVRRDQKAALIRGEYSEMVEKKGTAVSIAKRNMRKERMAKKSVGQRKMNEKSSKYTTQSKTDRRERNKKKAISRLEASVRDTKQVTNRLQREIMVQELRAEAFKLGERERMAKRKANLPKKIEKLIQQEAMLRKSLGTDRSHLKATRKHLLKQNLKTVLRMKNHKDRTTMMQTLQKVETQLVRGQGIKSVKRAVRMIKDAGPPARLAKLKVLDAKNQLIISAVRDFLSPLSEASLSLFAIMKEGPSRTCMLSGVDIDATAQDTYSNQGKMSVKCVPEAVLPVPGSRTKLPFRFHLVGMKRAGAGAEVGITMLEDITQPKGSNITGSSPIMVSPGPRRCSISANGLLCQSFATDVVTPEQKFMLIVSEDRTSCSLSSKVEGKDCSFKVDERTNRVKCVSATDSDNATPQQFKFVVLAPTSRRAAR